MKKILALSSLLLAGCTSVSETITTYDKDGKIITTIEKRDGRCTVQSHVTVLGIDLEIFDFLGNGASSPSKIRIGYISTDNQVTPVGYEAESKKIYDNILGDDKITVQQKTEGK